VILGNLVAKTWHRLGGGMNFDLDIGASRRHGSPSPASAARAPAPRSTWKA